MKETLKAGCCWVPKEMPAESQSGLVDLDDYYFKNNLEGKNWFYGSTDEAKYKYHVFMRSTQYNLTYCPIERPYVKEKLNECVACPLGGAFNIG